MADDRLLCCRWESIAATKSDNVMWRWPPISFRLFQNASSRLTLVLWPRTTTERLATGNFIKTHLLSVEHSATSQHKIRALLWPAGAGCGVILRASRRGVVVSAVFTDANGALIPLSENVEN